MKTQQKQEKEKKKDYTTDLENWMGGMTSLMDNSGMLTVMSE